MWDKYSRMVQVKFVEDSLCKNLKGYGLLKETKDKRN